MTRVEVPDPRAQLDINCPGLSDKGELLLQSRRDARRSRCHSLRRRRRRYGAAFANC